MHIFNRRSYHCYCCHGPQLLPPPLSPPLLQSLLLQMQGIKKDHDLNYQLRYVKNLLFVVMKIRYENI